MEQFICTKCNTLFKHDIPSRINGKIACDECTNEHLLYELGKNKQVFNEPEHYHKHDIDTIEFLQRGFPSQVFMGFAIGHVIKYAQRAEYKNGREDFVKMVDYAKRALDWYDKTHS